MAVSHPGSAGRRSLVEEEHKNVIFNDLGRKNCCGFFFTFLLSRDQEANSFKGTVF